LTASALRCPIEQTGIWDRTQELLILGQKIPTLGIEDTVIFLCVHGARERWNRLKWVCDLKFALQSKEVEWKEIISRSRQIGCYRVVLIGVLLASGLLGIDVPAALERDTKDYAIARSIAQRFQKAIENGITLDGADLVVCEVQSRDHAWDRILMLRRSLLGKWQPNDQDESVCRLPKSFSMLKYAIRPIRLGARYGLGWLKPLLSGRF